MKMKFAIQQSAANGTAALALMAALLEHLQTTGALILKDRVAILERAQRLALQDVVGITSTEALEILISMK